jgi:glycine cleavage system aminomethyltransferase T
MDELIVEGPQATEAFLAYHGINSFSNFDLNRAKHYVPVTPNGHVIGDHIIFREREDKYILVGRAPTSHWLLFACGMGQVERPHQVTIRVRRAVRKASACCASITVSRSRAPRRRRSSRR